MLRRRDFLAAAGLAAVSMAAGGPPPGKGKKKPVAWRGADSARVGEMVKITRSGVTTAPLITSGPTAGNVTQASADISWSVNQNATGVVDYGITPSFGLSSTPETSFDYASHVQTISGLAAGTAYYYRVRSSNSNGQETISATFSFTTQAAAGGFPPETTLSYTPTGTDPMPGLYVTIPVSEYGGTTEVTRITNAHLRTNSYPPRQPWNLNQDRIFLNQGWRLLDGTTYADLGTVPFGVEYPIWSNTDRDKMYGCSYQQNVIKRLSLASPTWQVIHTFAGKGWLDLGGGEGNCSDNDVFALIYNTVADGTGTWGVVVYDAIADVEVAQFAIGRGAGNQPNNCCISRSGQFVVIEHGTGGTGINQGTQLYEVVGNSLVRLRQIVTTRPHRDMGKDAAGRDILVYMEGPNGVSSQVLATGQVIDLFPAGGGVMDGGHVSCTNYNLPGWAYLSSNTRTAGVLGSDDWIAVKTDGSGTIRRFMKGHNPMTPNYDASPHMAASRDGLRIMGRTNWDGSIATNIFAYVAQAA